MTIDRSQVMTSDLFTNMIAHGLFQGVEQNDRMAEELPNFALQTNVFILLHLNFAKLSII